MKTLQQPPRKSKPRVVTFDDRLWPVNLLIAVLAGFAAIPLVVAWRFDEPRPLANTWTQLGILALVAIVAMVCSSLFDRRRLWRRLQLATLASLIVHIVFMVALYSQPFETVAVPVRPPVIPREEDLPQVFVAPDYAFQTPGVAAFERVEPDMTIAPDEKSSMLARLQPEPLETLPVDSPLPTSEPQLTEPPPAEPAIREESLAELSDREPAMSKRASRDIELSEPVTATLPPDESASDQPPAQPQPAALARTENSPDVVSDSVHPLDRSAAIDDDTRRFEVTASKPRLPERSEAPEPGQPGRVAISPRIAARVNVPQTMTNPVATPSDDVPTGENDAATSFASPSLPKALARRSVAGNQPSLPTSVGDGLGPVATPTPEIGLPSRRPSVDNELARGGVARSLGPKKSGPPAIDGRLREPAPAFAGRGGQRSSQGDADKSSPGSEAAIEQGLAFLARHQAADGSWQLNFATPDRPGSGERASFRSDSAATGLALLSFLGAGYDHYGGLYQGVVQRALVNLVQNQKPNGDLYRAQDAASNKSAWLYSHGIASIALCEAYGMTGDPALAAPAQRAINFIVAAQDAKLGAWRYTPGSGSDTSVSGWQLMALKSGELAGLNVRGETYRKVALWLDHAQAADSQFVYNPNALTTPEQIHGRRPTSAMTAVGLLMRLYTGWNRNDPRMIQGAEHLLGKLPERGSATQPARDTYYWYYATQVMFHMRGKYWQAWHERLQPMLVGEQITSGPLAGSWDPLKPVPDRWGAQGGRLYVTTLNLLSLEVYYRHLPIYESTAK